MSGVASVDEASIGSVLYTAGVTKDAWGQMLAIEAANRSVCMPTIMPYPTGRGNNIYMGKVGTRTVTARTRGTDDASDVTFSRLNDTKVSFTKRTTYDGIAYDWMVENELDPERLSSWLQAEGVQSADAIANDFDSTILGLHASAGSELGSNSANITWDYITKVLGTIRENNGRGPVTMIVPEKQVTALVNIEQLTRFNWTGESVIPGNPEGFGGTMFQALGVNIYTTNNCPESGGIAHGLAYTSDAIAYDVRDWIRVREWEDSNSTSQRLLYWADWMYALAWSTKVIDCQFTTTSSASGA